jgi:hypothetical protein
MASMVMEEQGTATITTAGPVDLEPSNIGMHDDVRNRHRGENMEMFHNITFHTFPQIKLACYLGQACSAYINLTG